MKNNKNRMVQQVSRNLQAILETELNTKVPYTQARRIIDKLDVEFTKNKGIIGSSAHKKESPEDYIINYNTITDKSLFKLPLGIDNNGNIKYWNWIDNSSMLITGRTGIGKTQLLYNMISYLESLPDDFDILYLHPSQRSPIKNSKNIDTVETFIWEIDNLLKAGPRSTPLFLFLDDIIFMDRMANNNDALSDSIFQLRIHLDSLLRIVRSYNIVVIATLQHPKDASDYFFFNCKLIENYHSWKKLITIDPARENDFTMKKLLEDTTNRDIVNVIYNNKNIN